MSQHEISKKWNISDEMVTGINTGRYWKHDTEYPIRKKIKKEYKCPICGCQISKGAKMCEKCSHASRAKNKPSKEELYELIIKFPISTVANLCDVSSTAIRKWCESYDLPSKKKDISQLKMLISI